MNRRLSMPDALLLGPCAALADRTGLNVGAARVLAVLLLCVAFKPVLVLYCRRARAAAEAAMSLTAPSGAGRPRSRPRPRAVR